MPAKHPGWTNEVREAADGHPVVVALDPIGGKLAEGLLDLLTPSEELVSYGQIAKEPISVPVSTLQHKSLTLRGENIGHWQSEASAERRASGVAAAKLITLALHDQFDVAATYGLGRTG
ncbi:hypothetical protein AB0D71_39305 [Streptomyces avermitilis]|uniref:hypothetical protein n=1 Tax=Streptomyces avermitilis TaxID=33903 RepID=UPI0033C03D90